jgi:hypothetical protein
MLPSLIFKITQILRISGKWKIIYVLITPSMYCHTSLNKNNKLTAVIFRTPLEFISHMDTMKLSNIIYSINDY